MPKEKKSYRKELFGTVMKDGQLHGFVQSMPEGFFLYDRLREQDAVPLATIGTMDTPNGRHIHIDGGGSFRFALLGVEDEWEKNIFLQFMDSFDGSVTLDGKKKTFAKLRKHRHAKRVRYQGLHLWKLPLIKMHDLGEVKGEIVVQNVKIEFRLHDVEIKPIPKSLHIGIRPSCHHGGRIRRAASG